MKKYKNLVVGGGLSGAVIANKLAHELQETVLVVEQKTHLAGTCYDCKNEYGITVHQYGPHIFHTNSKEIWEFLSQYTEWRPFVHQVLGRVDGKEIPIPFNLNSLRKVFPPSVADVLEEKLIHTFGLNTKIPILQLRRTQDPDLHRLAEYIYAKVFLGYTLKQWGCSPEQLDPSVTGSVPVRISREDGYFQDAYQAIPRLGYTQMIENMLRHPKIEVRLKTRFAEVQKQVAYERLIYTGPIEEFFNYKYGKLPYRSLDIKIKTLDTEKFQNAPVVNYPGEEAFTRITEYKYFLNEKSPKTTVSVEYPTNFEEGKNDRMYPILNEANQAVYNRYAAVAKMMPNTYFIGRLGAYRYYDMNRTIANALETFNLIKNKR